MLFWLLLTVTLAATAAIWWWLPRVIANGPGGLNLAGTMWGADWLDLVSIILPRWLRIVWHALLGLTAIALVEVAHGYALHEARTPSPDVAWLYPLSLVLHCMLVAGLRAILLRKPVKFSLVAPTPEPSMAERLCAVVMLVAYGAIGADVVRWLR